MGGLCSKSDTHGKPPTYGSGSGGTNGYLRGGNMLTRPRPAPRRGGYISPLESIVSGRNSSRIVARSTPKQSGHVATPYPKQSGPGPTPYPGSMLPSIEDMDPDPTPRLETFDHLSKQGTRMSDKCSRVSVSNVKLGSSSRPSTNFSKPEFDNEIDVYTRMGLVKNQPRRPYSELILRNKTFVVRDGNGQLSRPCTDTLSMPIYRASHVSSD